MELGMVLGSTINGEKDVLAFIRDLHRGRGECDYCKKVASDAQDEVAELKRRAGEERYSAEEISVYLQWCLLNGETVYDAWKNIHDRQAGIKAVTKRNKQQKG
jgi:hypothetical protein